MIDEEVTKGMEAANGLFNLGDTLTSLLVTGRETRKEPEVYYYILGVFSERIRVALAAIKDSKATALLNELANLTRRLLKPYDRLPQDPWGLWLACGTLFNYLRGKHGLPASGLSQLELMKQCNWRGTSGEDDIVTIIDKVTQYVGTLYKYKL